MQCVGGEGADDMNSLQSLAAESSRKPSLGERARSGLKGLIRKRRRASEEGGANAPQSEPLDAEVVEGSRQSRAEADAVARAVLDALNAHDPL